MHGLFKHLLAVVLMAGTAGAVMAQSATTTGSGAATDSSATGGTAGSGAAGGTSATTLGTGGTSTGQAGTGSTIGSGGSAATTDGRATSSTKMHENPNKLQGQSKAKAQDGGTWSKSRTKTTVEPGEGVSSRTKTMSHQPGGPPAKSTTGTTSDAQ
jgi:hypothetical protein